MSTEEKQLSDKVVHIGRVTKVVKGGRIFKFTALVVVGDHNGNVGIGHGKAREVPDAIRKAMDNAKKNMVAIPVAKGSIPHLNLLVSTIFLLNLLEAEIHITLYMLL